MKIHDREGFPNPSRIRVVLGEKGIEPQIEFVTVDLIGAEHKQPPFLAINPSGVVPVLELDDGTFISECTAITEYLDNLDADPILTGKTPLEKGMIHMMQRRAESDVLDPVGIYFHYATNGLGDTLRAYKDPDWAERKNWGERQGAKAVRGMRYFDGVLAERPYLAGDAFSMADITLFAGLNFADASGLAIPPELEALAAWRTRVGDRPSVKNRSGQMFVAEDLRRLGF